MQADSAATMSGINPLLVDRFKADGFLLVEDFFTAGELGKYAKSIDAAVRFRTADDNRSLSDKNLYEQTFIQCKGLWEDHSSVAPLTFHLRLCAAAAVLLESDCVRLWHDQALYKEAGGRQTDAHADFPFWPVDEPRLVSAWIPLDGVRLGGGVMGYVQGSHKIGRDLFVDIGQLRGGDPVALLQEPEVADRPFVWIEAPLGSVIFHHARTIHAAEANDTNATRRVYTTVYIADGCRRKGQGSSFGVDREGLAEGDLIAGTGFPVAWPRIEGNLPAPPAIRGPKTGFEFAE